ncbi:putative chitinase [Trichonephila clavipes]|nr:putative chitinase [Trichonephila clavipes]
MGKGKRHFYLLSFFKWTVLAAPVFSRPYLLFNTGPCYTCVQKACHQIGHESRSVAVADQKEINKYFVGDKGLGNVSGWDASIDSDPAKGGGGYNVGDYSKAVADYNPELLGSHVVADVH